MGDKEGREQSLTFATKPMGEMVTSSHKKTTPQLEKEKIQKNEFLKNLEPEYGLKFKEDWGTGSKNKKLNSNADITCIITVIEKLHKKIPNLDSKFRNGDNIRISLKTKGGDFTIANCGTTYQRTELFKYLNQGGSLTAEQIKTLFVERDKKVKAIKDGIISKNPDALWEDNYTFKNEVKKIYVDCLAKLFTESAIAIELLYKWLSERESDLKYIGDELIIPTGKIFSGNCKIKKNNDSVIVGEFKLRFKCESAKVKKPWKINIELANNNNF